ncbi:putative receptor-like protein kinase At5g39000 [Bidens hawaiensis]|uniref:putative receptor-like protein kinase At5g39000 n=1 Tax=Bidens hawaiensis TaxID=980011 RepID=UPI00404A1FDE
METEEGVKVNQWKAALREVADLKGMVLSGSEITFIKDIVHTISRALVSRLSSLDSKPSSGDSNPSSWDSKSSSLDSKPSSFVSEFEHLRIRLRKLEKATNTFSSKVIGTGGFGKVYEGVISHSLGRSLVAIKCLNREFGQGDPEFWKEIMMLSRYTHKNLISLLGFCDEDGEKILVYEHASHGSLDRHLGSTALTWTQRPKICLDAARGLAYLHDDKGTQQRVLHRDVKSANILLDENWNAKLSDMGLSKIGPANQRHTVLITNVVGTPGYCDPQYMETYSLTKESDIYSFVVVLFEVLCGRLCFKYTNNQLEILVPMWKQSYIDNKLDRVIFKDLTPSILDMTALETFSSIAFQCLHYSRERRPTISLLVERLKTALKFQKLHDMNLANAVGTGIQTR